MKTVNGFRIYEHGETIELPEGTPQLPHGVKAVYGMKLVGEGRQRCWIEADENDLKDLLTRAQLPADQVARILSAKQSGRGCHLNTSNRSCEGGCPDQTHEFCKAQVTLEGTVLACYCSNI